MPIGGKEEGNLQSVFKVPDERVDDTLAVSGTDGVSVDLPRGEFDIDGTSKEKKLAKKLLIVNHKKVRVLTLEPKLKKFL